MLYSLLQRIFKHFTASHVSSAHRYLGHTEIASTGMGRYGITTLGDGARLLTISGGILIWRFQQSRRASFLKGKGIWKFRIKREVSLTTDAS